jgi:hypothetical protein
MHDKIRISLTHRLSGSLSINKISLQKMMAGMVTNTRQVTGIPHLIEIKNLSLTFNQQTPNQRTTNEASSASNKNTIDPFR